MSVKLYGVLVTIIIITLEVTIIVVDYLIFSFGHRCYWGYCFESLATEDPRRGDGEGIHDVDANVEFCAVIKTKLGAHRILMGAEMDCCDSTDDGRRFYVELKTSREVVTPDYFRNTETIISLFTRLLIYGLSFYTVLTCKFLVYFSSWIFTLKKDMRERNFSSFGYMFFFF